jgi:hypothetical protein
MIEPHQVFVADAKVALALPTQHSAYVFGAASPLGEAMLNQLLASSLYTRVYVSTTAHLPGSVAHLHALIDTQPMTAQDSASRIDVVMIGSEAADSRSRSTVYANLLNNDVPALLRQVSGALSASVELRYALISPESAVSHLADTLAAYAPHAACMAYGSADGRASSARKQAYQFKPQADSVLDRLGAWVLNVLSNAAHGMLNPQTRLPLTSVKLAQRLCHRMEGLKDRGVVKTLQADDLIAVN